MEGNTIESWKNKEIFNIQLELNIKELNDNYPSHWLDFIKFLNIIS